MKTRSATYKHTEIFNILRQEILTGRYDNYERFPSEAMLAQRFKVSRPTITRALLGLKAAGLLSGRSGSGTYLGATAGYIGMIIPDRDWNSFFSTVANGIETAANKRGYTVLKDDCTAKDPEVRAQQMHQLANEFTTKRVKGVIVEPFDASAISDYATAQVLVKLGKASIPVVLLDRDTVPYPKRSDYDLVGIDNVQAGFRLARHLIDCGARRPYFYLVPYSGSAAQERLVGFEHAVISAGLPWDAKHVISCDVTDISALKKIFSGHTKPDAIGCCNDHMAAGLLQTLSSIKVRVPRDILMGGFDDCYLASMLNPPLTTIRQPAKEVAEVAFEQLLKRIEDPARPPCKILLDTTLTVRKSTQRKSRKFPK